MASIDTTPKSIEDHLAGLMTRVQKIEQRRLFTTDEEGRVRFPGGINTDGEGDAGDGGTPNAPTGLTLTPGALFSDVYIDAEWSLPPDHPAAIGVELRLDKIHNPGAGETFEIIDVRRTGLVESARLRGLEPNTVYELTVYTYGRLGQISEPLTGRATTVADSTLPAVPQGLVLSAGLSTIVARWDEVADRDVANGAGLYELELDTADTFPTPTSTRTSGTVTSIGDLDPGVYYGRLRAIDSSGNAGGWSDVATATIETLDLGRDFETDPILETEIADDAISTPKLQANVVTAGKVATDAIIARHVKAGEIVADKIASGAVTTDKMTANTINGDRIAANTLAANKISTGSLTATVSVTTGRLQVGSGPGNTGVYVDSSGIRLYSGSTVMVHLDASNGNAIFRGHVTASTVTASTIKSTDTSTPNWQLDSNGLRMLQGTSTARKVRWVDPSSPSTTTAELYQVLSGRLVVNVPNGIELHGNTLNGWILLRSRTGSLSGNGITLDAANVDNTGNLSIGGALTIGGGVHLRNDASNDLRLTSANTWARIGPRNTSWCHMQTGANGWYFYEQINTAQVTSRGHIFAESGVFRASNGTASTVAFGWASGIGMYRAGNDVHIEGSVFRSQSVYDVPSTTSSSVHVSPTGALVRFTSSENYKTNIVDVGADISRSVMALRPIRFHPNDKAILDRKDWSHYGFSAEEVAAVDPRLAIWAPRDREAAAEKYGPAADLAEIPLEELEPVSIDLAAILALTTSLVRSHDREIAALRDAVSALAGELADAGGRRVDVDLPDVGRPPR